MSYVHEDAVAAQRIALRNRASAVGLLAVGLIVTSIVVLYAKVDAENAAQKEFDFSTDVIRLNVVARLRACTQILQSGAALFDASASVERKAWQVFTQGLRLEQQLPGIQGVGFAQFIPVAQLADHVQSIRREGFPDYQVRPTGDRESYSAIIYLEPFTGRNLRAFGYDMLSEAVRRAAMERARDEQAVSISGKVLLVQETDEDVQAGTLMYFPVYRRGAPLETIAQRRAALVGWVYSPYRMADLLRGSLMGWEMRLSDRRINFQVYDGNVVSAATLLFDNQSPGGKTLASDAQVSRLLTVDFAGHRWTLRFTQLGGLAAAADYRTAWLAFFGGGIVSLLLFWLTLSLLGTRANAQRRAEYLTQELRQKSERLELATRVGGVGIWDYEVVNNRLVWDDQMFRLYGIAREQFGGAYEAWQAGVHPEDRQRGNDEVQQALRSEKEFETEFRVLWPDGSTRHIRALGFVQRDASGQPARMIGTNWDITERIRQEHKLRDLIKQTEQDACTKGGLLREVNHRVTNNLTAVLGLMAFENRYSRGDPQSIAGALERLSQRIRGLLHVHRMLSQSSWAPVPVNELAGQIIRAALHAAHWRQPAAVTIKPSEVRVSPRQAGALAMVINELATNTVKHAQQAEGPFAISFEVERGPEFITLRYQDNGPGYPPEVLAQERSNIGLKLIKELVGGTLGGQVAITNDRGAVTTLRIALEEETRT